MMISTGTLLFRMHTNEGLGSLDEPEGRAALPFIVFSSAAYFCCGTFEYESLNHVNHEH